jgi:2-C-methyl-D-erythritol 4-phosphate cytidylyltransferase
VRPLIDAATIDRTIDAVAEHGAAIVGMPAVDTIKQVERTAHGALITSTIPREFVVLAQTPQGFRFGLLQRPSPRPPPTALWAPTKPRSSNAPDIR